MNTKKPCTRCGSLTRKIVSAGRCASCNRAVRKERSEKSWAQRIWETYGITPEEYEAIKAKQGGRCAVCQRATGLRKRLAIDHDHKVEKELGSRASVRGVLCSTCNNILGHLRDDPEAFQRAIDYLKNPPARGVLGT